jgi:hypothetical protein
MIVKVVGSEDVLGSGMDVGFRRESTKGCEIYEPAKHLQHLFW